MLKACPAVLLLMLGFAATKPASAQVTVDVAKITCQQFVLFAVTDPRDIAIWLSGYYNGKRNNTVVDTTQLKELAEKLKNFCIINSKTTVMEAAEKVVAAAGK